MKGSVVRGVWAEQEGGEVGSNLLGLSFALVACDSVKAHI